MGGHAGTSLVTYASGHRVVLRHVSDLVPPRFYEHQYPVTVARISPNGSWVASGDVSGRVRVWGLNEDMTLKAEHHPLSGAVADVAWSHDGQRIVCCGEGKQSFAKVFLWDSGSAVGDVSGSTKRVNSCDFKPSRPFRIATASEDFAVSFYEGPPFKFASTPHRHGNFANCVRFSPDGAKFASVGSDGAGVVYDGRTGAPIAELPAGGEPAGGAGAGHVGTVYACAWSPDSAKLLTAGADKTCKLWAVPRDPQGDAATTPSPAGGKTSLPRLEKLADHSFGETVGDMQVGCVFVGDVAVTLSLSGDLNFIDDPEGSGNTSGKRVVVRSGHPKPIGALAVCKTTGDAFVASLDAVGRGASILRWRDGDGCVAKVIGPGHTSAVVGVVRAGAYLVTAGLDDHVRVASIETNSYESAESSRLKLPAQPRSMGADDAGALVAVATGDGVAAYAFDGTLGTLGTLAATAAVGAGSGGKGEPSSVCVRGDGREVAVGCKDGAVRLFSVAPSERRRRRFRVRAAVFVGPRGGDDAAQGRGDGVRVLARRDSAGDVRRKPRGARLGSNRRRRRFRQDGVPQVEGDVRGVERGRREARDGRAGRPDHRVGYDQTAVGGSRGGGRGARGRRDAFGVAGREHRRLRRVRRVRQDVDAAVR